MNGSNRSNPLDTLTSVTILEPSMYETLNIKKVDGHKLILKDDTSIDGYYHDLIYNEKKTLYSLYALYHPLNEIKFFYSDEISYDGIDMYTSYKSTILSNKRYLLLNKMIYPINSIQLTHKYSDSNGTRDIYCDHDIITINNQSYIIFYRVFIFLLNGIYYHEIVMNRHRCQYR